MAVMAHTGAWPGARPKWLLWPTPQHGQEHALSGCYGPHRSVDRSDSAVRIFTTFGMDQEKKSATLLLSPDLEPKQGQPSQIGTSY